jgi:NAD(P)-dependent dehydrogenase (short-subunit alcohol dehydrogenase family)
VTDPLSGAVEHDVRDEQSSTDVVRAILRSRGRLDILVNNAGVGPRPGPFHTLTVDEYDRVMSINARGLFLTSKAATPPMIEQRSGRIIHISSVVAKRASPNILPYAASKWAVTGMTQVMARELAQYDITVNAVCPGVIRTQLHEGVVSRMSTMTGKEERDVWQTFYDRIALGRLQEPDDIAEMVTYLASDRARNITGSAFNVNGGMEFN